MQTLRIQKKSPVAVGPGFKEQAFSCATLPTILIDVLQSEIFILFNKGTKM